MLRILFDPWIRDPGWVKIRIRIRDPDPELSNPDHISESLETIFWVKILELFDADPGFAMEKIRIRNPGSQYWFIHFFYIHVYNVTTFINLLAFWSTQN